MPVGSSDGDWRSTTNDDIPPVAAFHHVRSMNLTSPRQSHIPSPTMKKPAVVLYPTSAVGHLISMVELGKLVLTHHPSLSVHVLISSLTFDSASTAPYISSVSSSTPGITFHCLPAPSLPPDISTLELLRLNNPNIRHSLESISEIYSVDGFIADFFCACAAPVVRELGIPCYFFFTSGGSALALFLHFPVLHDSTADQGSEQDKSKLILHIPGIPPFPLLYAPKSCWDRNFPAYDYFLDSSLKASLSAGVIVNTFDELEGRAVEAIRRGECRLGERIPIFCIGPLISSNNRVDGVDDCLMWLNGQPKGRVVFLCFGSLGVFSKEQLKEIAAGLEMSGQRFLWVVRHPSVAGDKSKQAVDSGPEPELASLLPEGFLERTKGRGMVMDSWAPQVEVLGHEAVGGFMTHCGWNSVLEAVCAAVPMVAWPLYAEQRLNRVVMVEEIGIALMLEEKEDGSVGADEVEKKLRMLMEGKEGEAVRAKTKAMKEAAVAAVEKGGSSCTALEELVESWKR